MRVEIRRGVEHFCLAPAHTDRGIGKLVEFESFDSALLFLRRNVDGFTMRAARHEIDSVRATVDVHRVSQDEILQRLAAGVVRGSLRLRKTETPSREYMEVEEAPEESDIPLEDARKWPPDPEVPPEYILAAWMESNEIKRAREYLHQELEDLKYKGFGIPKHLSQVAPEYIASAETASSEISVVRDGTIARLENMRMDGIKLDRPISEVAHEYINAATQSATQIRSSVESYNATLEPLRKFEVDLSRPASQVAGEYLSGAKQSGERVTSAVADFAAGLNALKFPVNAGSLVPHRPPLNLDADANPNQH